MHFSLQLKLGGWPTFDFAIQGCINQAISQEQSSLAQNLLTKISQNPAQQIRMQTDEEELHLWGLALAGWLPHLVWLKSSHEMQFAWVALEEKWHCHLSCPMCAGWVGEEVFIWLEHFPSSSNIQLSRHSFMVFLLINNLIDTDDGWPHIWPYMQFNNLSTPKKQKTPVSWLSSWATTSSSSPSSYAKCNMHGLGQLGLRSGFCLVAHG